MNFKILNDETVEYSIYAVTRSSDEAIELNDECKYASGFKNNKMIAIGYAICIARNFNFTDVFIVESRTINNYWSNDDAVTTNRIVWQSVNIGDESIEFDDDESLIEFDDEEITEETDELVDS